MASNQPTASNVAAQTIQQALRHLREAFAAAGIGADAAGDARRLLAQALNVSAAGLIRDPARVLTADEAATLDAFARRRIAREPVTRILGEREFYGRPFTVTPAVLDPRADTETLIDAALIIARDTGWDKRPISILDIGTGSGAIILTLLAELPLAKGVAIDVSQDALAIAGANAKCLGLSNRVSFACRDIFADLPSNPLHGFDLVVSNPPYIPSAHISILDPEVSRYDPLLALDGGSDGLAFYRAILEFWAKLPNFAVKQRALVMELGAGQCDAVKMIATRTGPPTTGTIIETFCDLGGHERCVAVRSQSVS